MEAKFEEGDEELEKRRRRRREGKFKDRGSFEEGKKSLRM